MARTVTSAWMAAGCVAAIVSAPSIASAAGQTPGARKSTAASKPRPKAATPPAGPAVPMVTLTGCLEAHKATYVLTDLRGNASPKRRDWKTGFIKKRAKDIDVVSASPTLKLKDHVGHQVAVTGVRDDADRMKARSLKHLAGSCS
jgi:hypothetical protein